MATRTRTGDQGNLVTMTEEDGAFHIVVTDQAGVALVSKITIFGDADCAENCFGMADTPPPPPPEPAADEPVDRPVDDLASRLQTAEETIQSLEERIAILEGTT